MEMSPEDTLFTGAKRGDVDMIVAARAAGMDVNAVDSLGNTPLHYAAAAGHSQAVVSLLATGALPDIQNQAGDTPLHKAAGRGHREVVDSLVSAGADLSIKNALGHTAADGAVDTVKDIFQAAAGAGQGVDFGALLGADDEEDDDQ